MFIINLLQRLGFVDRDIGFSAFVDFHNSEATICFDSWVADITGMISESGEIVGSEL